VGIMKIKEDGKFKRILIPTAGGPNAKLAFTAGGPNAKLAFQWGNWLARQNKGKVTLLSVVKDKRASRRAEGCLLETRKGVSFEPAEVEEKVVFGRNVLETILEEAKTYDLILIGASKAGLWRRVRFGTIPEKLTRLSPISVLVVRKYDGVIRSWLRRFLAG